MPETPCHRCQFKPVVAHGPARLHAPANTRRIAGAPDRAGNPGGRLVAGAAIMLGTLVLWFHYGTAVFFEMIAAGFNACF